MRIEELRESSWVYGIGCAVFFGFWTWFGHLNAHLTPHEQIINSGLTGALFGTCVAVYATYTPSRTDPADGGKLSRAEQAAVRRMLRNGERNDDPRLNRVATKAARRIVSSSNHPLTFGIVTAVVLLLDVVTVMRHVQVHDWVIAALLVGALPLGIGWGLRRRATARAYLAAA